MPKRKKAHFRREKAQKTLDPYLEKRSRGRPTQVARSTVTGRAENYRGALEALWLKLNEPLLAAKDDDGVTEAFEKYGQPYANNFAPRFSGEILALIRDPLFPKRARAQVSFLAESLAGRPEVSARRSRDICAKERQHERAQSPHKILRKEFYVECSCGYKGPALNNACRKCGAGISLVSEILLLILA